MKPLRLLNVFIALMLWNATSAQIVVMRDQEKIDADSIRRDYDNRPYFGLYKDNYFTIGTSIGSKPTR